MTNHELNFININAADLRGTIKLQIKYDPQQMNPSQHLGGIGYVLTRLTYAIITNMLDIRGDSSKHVYYNWAK